MCLFKCGKPSKSRFIFLFTLFIFIRKSILIFLKKYCAFEGTLIIAWLMFGGELFIGLCNIFIEYKKLINVKIEKFIGIPIITSKKDPHHSKCHKVLLFLFCAALDFSYYFFLNYHVTKKYSTIVYLLDIKLSPFILIFASIICAALISQKVGIAQIISIFIILISLAGIISAEFLIRKNDNNNEIKLLIYIIGCYFFSGLQYFVEKYLMEYDNSTPFQILFYEGIFGNIAMIILSFFNIEKKFPDTDEIKHLWALIIGFILYFLASCFLNIYRLSVILSSSPTNAATSHSFAIPLIIILSYFINKSEINDIENKWLYLGINSTSIIFIILSCLFFNEIILFICQDINNYDNKGGNKNIKINDSFLSGSQNRIEGSFTSEGEDSF